MSGPGDSCRLGGLGAENSESLSWGVWMLEPTESAPWESRSFDLGRRSLCMPTRCGETGGESRDMAVLPLLMGQIMGDWSMLAFKLSITLCTSSIFTSRSPFNLLCISSIWSATGSMILSRRLRDRLGRC